MSDSTSPKRRSDVEPTSDELGALDPPPVGATCTAGPDGHHTVLNAAGDAFVCPRCWPSSYSRSHSRHARRRHTEQGGRYLTTSLDPVTR